jgi:hypothetical protein
VPAAVTAPARPAAAIQPPGPRNTPTHAAVIAALWADIINEDPDFYATLGGMASLHADTEFLPCTSGLPAGQ